MSRRTLEHLAVAAGVVAVVLAAVLANARTRLFYQRSDVRRTTVLGRPIASQDALAEVVAVSSPTVDTFDEPVRTNPGRGPARVRHQAAVLRVLTGINRGRLVLAQNVLQFSPANSATIAEGSWVHVSVTTSGDSVDDVLICKPIIRFPVIIYVVAALLCAAILVLRIRGLALAAALLLSVLGLSLLVFPLVLHGVPPLLAASMYAVLMMVLLVLVLEGWGRAGIAAIIGACGGMAVAVAAALVAAGPLKLSGYPTTFSIMLKEALPPDRVLSFTGLLTAGTVVCVLGIVLDLGVSVAAAVDAVCRQASTISYRTALAAGMRMNRDVLGTMLLTLVFVWVGQSLCTMMLPRALDMSLRELLNSEAMAVELLELAAGGIGLVAAGPITALAAVWLFMQRKQQDASSPAQELSQKDGSQGMASLFSQRAVEKRNRRTRNSEQGTRNKKRRGSGTGAEGTRPWPLWLVLAAELAVCAVCGIGIASAAREAHRGTAVVPHGAAGMPPKRASSDDLHLYASEQLASGNEAQAALALWQAVKLDPRSGVYRRELARLYVGKRWFVIAHAEASRALDLLPDDSDTHYVAGVVLVWLGDENGAKKQLQKALDLDPKNSNASDALAAMFGEAMKR